MRLVCTPKSQAFKNERYCFGLRLKGPETRLSSPAELIHAARVLGSLSHTICGQPKLPPVATACRSWAKVPGSLPTAAIGFGRGTGAANAAGLVFLHAWFCWAVKNIGHLPTRDMRHHGGFQTWQKPGGQRTKLLAAPFLVVPFRFCGLGEGMPLCCVSQ